MGLDPKSDARWIAGLRAVVASAARAGHTKIPVGSASRAVAELLSVPARREIMPGVPTQEGVLQIDSLRLRGQVVENVPLVEAERKIAARIGELEPPWSGELADVRRLYPYAWQTGDPQDWFVNALAASSACAAWREIADKAITAHKKGNRIIATRAARAVPQSSKMGHPFPTTPLDWLDELWTIWPTTKLDKTEIPIFAPELEPTRLLNHEQRAAVYFARAYNVVVITGGPGTGKTTTCKAIVDVLEQTPPAKDKPPTSIALCAPTGKAAKRLSEQTGRDARTIHRLLGELRVFSGADADGRRRILNRAVFPYGVVIVDESSMIDVELGARLLAAVADGAKVIFVGDAEQLPSVGPGAFLRDLIASQRVPVVELQTVYRQSADSWIAENAARLNRGAKMHLDNASSKDFYWWQHDDVEQLARWAVKLTTERIPAKLAKDKLTRYETLRDVQVLCPQRTGPLGVDALNRRLRAAFYPELPGVGAVGAARPTSPDQPEQQSPTPVVGDKVIQTRNDYDLEVFNGEAGVVVDFSLSGGRRVNFGDRTVDYSAAAAAGLQLAYATTIHKSQGSEWPAVVAFCHSANAYMLNRSLLYTAITRGKQQVHLLGDQKGLRLAKRDAERKRQTTLREQLERLEQKEKTT
jgi:RecD/TraA family predicted helicase